MATQPTVREMQNAIMTLRRFAEQDDYNLCREWQKGLVFACADVLDTLLAAREWRPIMEDDE